MRPLGHGRWRAYVLAAAGGVLATTVAAVASGASFEDGVKLVALAVGGAAVVAALGTAVGRRLRTRPIALQVAVVALTALAATLAGSLLAARAMFVSPEDLWALVVVIGAGSTAALLAALGLASRLGQASARVAELPERLAADPAATVEGPLPAELAAITAALTDTWGRLAEARDRERAMEASRRELVAWVSHDLRTPLAGIRAMVEALEDGVVDEPATVARYLTTIRQEADRLAQLVDDLFELSRIQAGAATGGRDRVELGDLVSDAIAASDPAASARGVVLEGALREPAPLVTGSAPDLSRVVRNLLDNAIRHTPRGGAVRVEAATDGGDAVLSVRDSCGGIPEQDLDRVFDLAFRGDVARTPGEASGGFGLAIARGLVEAHHGLIDVTNEEGGCQFTVRLPLDR